MNDPRVRDSAPKAGTAVHPRPSTEADEWTRRERATRPAGPAGTGLRRRSRRRARWQRLPLHLGLLALCLVWIYPFLWMASASVKPDGEIFSGGAGLIPQDPTLDNYVRAWDVANFGQYFLNTVIVTGSVVLLVIAVSSLAGYALGRGSMPGKKVVVVALVATMFLPKSFSILPVFLLVNSLGLNGTLAGIILAESGPAHVVAILLFMGFFARLPDELEEAAIMDGASHPRIYLSIMLPLAKPVIGAVAIFNFMAAWNSFLIPLVFTLNKPELRTLGVGIYSFFGEFSTDWNGLAAAAILTIAPVVAVFLWLQRYFIEGIAGAVKN